MPEPFARVPARRSGVFHFAGQTAVTTSLVNPREDFEINALGAITLLEELRALRFPIPLAIHVDQQGIR